MKTHSFEVLSPQEIRQIHAASMQILATVGVKVDYALARQIFGRAGAIVDEAVQSVRIPEALVMQAIEKAPKRFRLYGADGKFNVEIGGGEPVFAALGTPTSNLDLDTGERRPSTLQDLVHHIQLIDSCHNIHCMQMDVWPTDLPMTTIHTEAIWAWAHHSRKPFGMGCYAYRPTLDMMEMMAIASGGRQAFQQHPSFFGICSTVSPLQMTQIQLEGMLICASYGQPVTMSPEGIAGTTAPVTLAGLLVQENANILAHITLAQLFRPGTPVVYGTVSTIANLRNGTVALGAVETGLITAASVQLAKSYGLPCRSVGSVTEAKREDYQAGFERFATLLPAVMGGVDYITCAGTLDSSMLESDALLVLDDEVCGAALRMRQGIEVNEKTLALDIISKVGFSGSYITEKHTMQNYRSEHFLPQLLVREPYEGWQQAGSKSALDNARVKALQLLADHQAVEIDFAIEKELQAYRQMVADRPMEDFYKYEAAELQGFLLEQK
jgi:trimethylamine---corrinoid protein Co-methyltransferase